MGGQLFGVTVEETAQIRSLLTTLDAVNDSAPGPVHDEGLKREGEDADDAVPGNARGDRVLAKCHFA